MTRFNRSAFVASSLVLGTALGAIGSPAYGEAFYAGKTINFIIASAVGGGYDTYGRLAASHLGQNLPGHPSVVPQNMPGASGIRAANYLYTIAPKDGTAIGMVDQALYLDQILGKPELTADTTKFNWIGRITSNNAVLFATATAPVKTIEDAMSQELIVSASGTSSKLRWTVLQRVVGLKAKIISAYKGTNESRLAMQRGEVQALSMPWTVLKSQEAQAIADKSINLLLQTGLEKAPDLQQVPRMIDLAKNDEDRRLLTLFSSPDEIGRSVLAPPGLPAARVAELRQAFMAMIKDPAFLRDAQKLKLELDPLSGEELQKLASGSNDIPPALIKRARAMTEP
jgi:tripartite-type tricarboxylate transporter receptor subunit TctC